MLVADRGLQPKRSCQVRRRPGTNRIGYKPHHPTPPNLDQRHPTFPQATGHPGHQGPGRRSTSRATSASAVPQPANQMLPRRAGRVSGMADTSAKPVRWGGLGVASRRPPRGLPRGSPGARLASSTGGEEGWCPRGAAWSGYARSTGCHTASSAQDHQWLPGIEGITTPAAHRMDADME